MMKSDPKAQFANIIEKINEGFVALDAGMNYTYINQRGSELRLRLFGGRMEVDSTPGSGTRFFIHIPTVLEAES